MRDYRFCPVCGAVFDPSREAEIGSEGGASPRLARQRRRLARAREALVRTVPERKQVTVMFADLCGSTSQIAAADPEEAQSYLDRALSLMIDAVEAYGGTVSQVLGDGLLALFGAPVAQEDHAVRACLAAMTVQQRAGEVLRGDDANAAGAASAPLLVRIGIHSGEVIVGSASEYLSSHYRADGTTIHLAARLEEAAAPGRVLISDATWRLVQNQVEARSLGRRKIRGFEGSIGLYELALNRVRSAAAPLARRQQLSPLVGRSDALRALLDVAHAVRAGQMQCVGLRGEAGIGKSRLLGEFGHELRGAGYSVCSVGGRAYASHIAFRMAADLLRELMGVSHELDQAAQVEAIRAVIASWPDSARGHVPAAMDLLDLGYAGDAWAALTPTQRRRGVRDLLLWLLNERLACGPLLLVIDDVHWADRESQRLLESVLPVVADRPLLVCTCYRPEHPRRAAEPSWFSERELGPLDRGDILHLAAAMLGAHPSIGDVVVALVDRAAGNPLFLEQMAMTLVDDGTLVGAPGAYRSNRADAAVRVPASITTVIGARVDRMPAPAKASLEAAAVLGEKFEAGLVAAMRGLPAASVAGHLHLAAAAGLLDASSSMTGLFAFRHALVQESVLAALTRPRRKMLHRAALGALRALGDEPSPEQVSLLCQHAYRGEAWADAADFARKSMAASIARSATRDALRTFDLGMDAVRHLATDPAALRLELGLRMEAVGALLTLGESDAIVANLERAEVITKLIGDRRAQAAVLLQLAGTLWTRGNYTQGIGIADAAEEVADRAGSRTMQIAAAHVRMMQNHGLGRYPAVAAGARAIAHKFVPELATRRIMPGWAVIPSISVKAFLADALARMGEIDEAHAACSAAYVELEELNHPFSRAMVEFIHGSVLIEQGRYAEAVQLLGGALDRCTAHDLPTMTPAVLFVLAGAMARNGQAEAALTLLQRAIADGLANIGGRYNDYYLPFNHAIALAEAGRYDEAMRAATEARAAAVRFGQRAHEAYALFELAEIEVAAGQAAAGLGHFEEARDAARDCAMASLQRRAVERVEQVAAGLRLMEYHGQLSTHRGGKHA